MSHRFITLFGGLAFALGICCTTAGCGGGSKITKANADRINNGMSEKQVAEILGTATDSVDVQAPDILASGFGGGDAPLKKAKQSIWKDGSKVITVIFINDKVVSKFYAEDSSGSGSGSETAKLDERVFEQKGTFGAVASEEGSVNFPIPYALPPNVELTEPDAFQRPVVSGSAIVKDVTTTGFKWKGIKAVSITWTAKGIKATKLPET